MQSIVYHDIYFESFVVKITLRTAPMDSIKFINFHVIIY